MTHLDKHHNEEFIYIEDEANRLRTTLNMMYLLDAVFVIVALVAGLFWLFTQDVLPVVLIGISVVVLAINAWVIHKNRPRFMRLISIRKSLGDLLHELIFRDGFKDADKTLEFGSVKNGLLLATMLDKEGQAWEVKALAPSGMIDGVAPKVAFHAIATRTELRSAATNKLLPLSSTSARMIVEMTHLVRATAGFETASVDLLVTQSSIDFEAVETAAAAEQLGFSSPTQS